VALTKQSRYTFYVVGVLVLACLAGYFGGKVGSDGDSTQTVASSGDSAKASWVDKIKKAGVLRVGCADAPPTIIVKTAGTCTGADLVPLESLADDLGVKIKTVATTWQNIVAGLQADKYDVAADLDQTVERSLAISFTHGSWSYPGVFLAERVRPAVSGLQQSADTRTSGVHRRRPLLNGGSAHRTGPDTLRRSGRGRARWQVPARHSPGACHRPSRELRLPPQRSPTGPNSPSWHGNWPPGPTTQRSP